MNLSQMVVGKVYLVGDGMGYDKVECLSVNDEKDFEELGCPQGCTVARIKYLSEDRSGMEDIFVESDGYSLCIEEV
jgi:hypothetical protein